jgi:hypothetical protein
MSRTYLCVEELCNCLLSEPEAHCSDDCETQHKYENVRGVEAATKWLRPSLEMHIAEAARNGKRR